MTLKIVIKSQGTYKALENHLRDVTAKQGEGYYHVIHFDVHGAVLNYGQLQKRQEASRYLYKRYAREKAIQPYEGVKAFLSFEPEADDREHTSDLVEADELANLLVNYHIPITILNACQSGDSGSHEHDGFLLVKGGRSNHRLLVRN